MGKYNTSWGVEDGYQELSASPARTKRGLASFVSFFLLFAVALGQTALTAHAGAAPDTPGPPSGDGEQPTLLSGNQNCAEVAEFLFEYRDNSPGDDTVDLAAESDGAITGTLTIDVHTGGTFDFWITGGWSRSPSS